MKVPLLCLGLVCSFVLSTAVSRAAESVDRVFELRTYTAAPGKKAALLARFRDHTLRIFERHGMVNVGYWTPADAKDGAEEKLIYLLEHSSRDAAAAAWKAFSADAEWQSVKSKSEMGGKIVSKVESVFLKPTDYSGSMKSVRSGPERVFEMRTYVAPEGKLDALDARFRDHTLRLFAKQGMQNLGYFHPTDASKGAANTLIYFLAYPSREAAAASWKAFREDADWTKARTESERGGKLTTKVESVFLVPTDFSPLR